MPIRLFRGAVQPHGAVAKPFEGFLFICGGELGGGDRLRSVRQHVLAHVQRDESVFPRNRIIVAEKVTDLLEGSDFSNLLEFEDYLAALAACVVIIVESPGSIAELGSFAVMAHLSQKLLVVCEEVHQRRPSFISKGPLAYLRRTRGKRSVRVFPLHAENADGSLVPSRDLIDDCWEFLSRAILESLRRPVPESALEVNRIAHRLLLTTEIVDLLVVSRIKEIRECVNHFGDGFSQRELSRTLRILEKFELITSRTYSHEKFYLAIDPQQRITFKSSRPAQIFDRERFKFDISNHYAVHDRIKLKALKAYQRAKVAA